MSHHFGIEDEAKRIMALPESKRRAAIAATLDCAKQHELGSHEYAAALDYNAHLCTTIRELCQVREIATPWG
jgi:hypothetical protein